MISPERAELLADPATSLPAFGTVVDQASGDNILFDPHRITVSLQQTLLAYISQPPMDPYGHTMWLNVLTGRQSGKSTTSALGFYPPMAYTPGWQHATIADNQKRADMLHERLMLCHEFWPREIRTEQKRHNESRSISFENGSKGVTLSAHADVVGIGRSISSVLASEVAFWRDASEQWSFLQPSLINRTFSRVIMECTPAPLSAPSAPWWRDQCFASRRGNSRFAYAFFPFWDSLLNRRKWPEGQHLDSEEQALMEKYGPLGLQLDNLQFRRVVMDTDDEIRRNVDLFKVYYPFDDITCWVTTATAVIPVHLLRDKAWQLLPEDDDYTEFFPPNRDSMYLIGVDPAGYGGKDHAAFQVLELWSGEWKQVASFGAVIDPEAFVNKLIEVGLRYNQADIVVESNGVGAGTISLLLAKGYPRMYYSKLGKPGFHKKSDEEMVSVLVDALTDSLEIYGEDTYNQVCNYQSDRAVEQSQRSLILGGGRVRGNRRSRHHWDKVSALMVACAAARTRPNRIKRVEPVVAQTQTAAPTLTWNEEQQYRDRMRKKGIVRKRMAKVGRRR